MQFKHIHFIINPASSREEPMLNLIHQALKDSRTDWDVTLTKKNVDSGQIARRLIGKTDLVAVYGGDGCVTSAAAALRDSKLPMAIIPGGTANEMAGELGIPADPRGALALLQKGRARLQAVDMGLVNGEAFLLRVNFGIMADMVIGTGRELKDQVGQLAYGITTLKTLARAEPLAYQLRIDGQKKIEVSGVALTVTNAGHMGIGELELVPGISITDGKLDIVLMPDSRFASMLEMTGSVLLHRESSELQHWRCRRVSISLPKKRSFICDDAQRSAQKIKIRVLPKAIRLLLPKT